MIRLFYFISFFAICEISFAQTKPKPPISNSLKQPKLVIGIVVDQMRQDYIYRYWNKFGNGGFKKLINEGFFYKNAHFNYVPTYTGPGHASIYTGTSPATHGIIANDWYDKETNSVLIRVTSSTRKSSTAKTFTTTTTCSH